MDNKLDQIIEILGQIQMDITSAKTDINTIKADIKKLKDNDIMIIDTIADIKEDLTALRLSKV